MEEDYQTFSLCDDFRVYTSHHERKVELSDIEKQQIDGIWSEGLSKEGKWLFDGQILSANEWSESFLRGDFVPYREYFAETRQSSLFSKLRIRPVGITGYTYLDGKLLLGKRADNLAQFAGFHECAPSGGVDPSVCLPPSNIVDVRTLVLKELAEETGITSVSVKSVHPALLVIENDRSIEIIYLVELKGQLQDYQDLKPNREYSLFEWVGIDEALTDRVFSPMTKKILQVMASEVLNC